MSDEAPSFAPDDATFRKGGGGRSNEWSGGPDKGPSRGPLIALTILLLMAVAAAIVAIVIVFPDPPNEPYFVSIQVGEYQNPAWPRNAFTEQDSMLIWDRVRRKQEEARGSTQFASQEAVKIRSLLKDIEAGRHGDVKAPLIIYVNTLALAGRDEQIYLLPVDAVPGDEKTWVPLEELLKAVAECPAKQKVLFLDISHPIADTFNGILVDDVATKLDDFLTKKKPDYLIVTSCGPGELSLRDDPNQNTAFATYLAAGLRGAAAIYGPGKQKEDPVSIQALAKFASARVSRFCHHVHDRKQAPKLFGPADDFSIVYVPADRREPPADPEAYPSPLQHGWELRDAARGSKADRGLPASFARLTGGLQNAEHHWIRSGSSSRLQTLVSSSEGTWKAELSKAVSPVPATDLYHERIDKAGKHWLAAARAGRPKPPDDMGIALDQYVAALVAKPPVKDEEKAKSKEAWQSKIKDPIDAAWVIWQRAANSSSVSSEQLTTWVKLIADLQLPRAFAETLVLEAVTTVNFRDRSIDQFPGVEVAAFLRCERDFGMLVALGPEGIDLAQASIREAIADRSTGERELMAARTREQLDRSRVPFAKSSAKLAEAADTLVRWQQAIEAVSAGIAVILETADPSVRFGVPKFEDWEAAVKDTSTLADELDKTQRTGEFDKAKVEDLSRRVAAARTALRAPFEPAEIEKVLKPPAPRVKASESRILDVILSSPIPTAVQRKGLVEAQRTETAKRATSVREQDYDDDEKKETTHDPRPNLDDTKPIYDLGYRRARAAVALLKLAGYPDWAVLDEPLRKFDANRKSAELSLKLGDRIRIAWLDKLRKHRTEAFQKKDWFAADRSTRVIPSSVARLRVADEDRETAPPAVIRAREVIGIANQLVRDHLRQSQAARQVWVNDPMKPEIKNRIAEFFGNAIADFDPN